MPIARDRGGEGRIHAIVIMTASRHDGLLLVEDRVLVKMDSVEVDEAVRCSATSRAV